jgi:tetratricopeptide (TPR) repeat protein
MTERPDDTMAEVAAVTALAQGGHTEEARKRFAEIWDRVGSSGDPLHRCAIAHYAADVQTDLNSELLWDLRALEAANEISDERAKDYHQSLAVANFYPSLHLNLADVHRRLGDVEEAIYQLERARATVGTLPDDGYGRMIRGGIARCAERMTNPGGS